MRLSFNIKDSGLDIIENPLLLLNPAFNSTVAHCHVYVLPYGIINLTLGVNNVLTPGPLTLHDPAVYISNCTQDVAALYDAYYRQFGWELVNHNTFDYIQDPFWGGTMAWCVALMCVTLLMWMVVVLMLLTLQTVSSQTTNQYVYNQYTNSYSRTSPLHNHLQVYRFLRWAYTARQRTRRFIQLLVVVFAVMVSITMDHTISLLKEAYTNNYQDVKQLQKTVLLTHFHKVAVLIIPNLMVNIGWLMVVFNFVKYRWRVVFLGVGTVFIVVILVLDILSQYADGNPNADFTESTFSATTGVVLSQTVLSLVYYLACGIFFWLYTLQHSRFAYNRRLWFLALFNLVMFLGPVALQILMLPIVWFRSWATFLAPFMKIISLYMVDVWMTSIDHFSGMAEKKGVLGRRLSDEEIGKKERKLAAEGDTSEGRVGPDGHSLVSEAYDTHSESLQFEVVEADQQSMGLQWQEDVVSSSSSDIYQDDPEETGEQETPQGEGLSLQPAEPTTDNPPQPPERAPSPDRSPASLSPPLDSPPAFTPHPGFQHGDYYDEKQRRHFV